VYLIFSSKVKAAIIVMILALTCLSNIIYPKKYVCLFVGSVTMVRLFIVHYKVAADLPNKYCNFVQK